MTTDGNFKKVVRERMDATGEKYTTARRTVLQSALQDPETADPDVARYLRSHPEVAAEMQRMMPED